MLDGLRDLFVRWLCGVGRRRGKERREGGGKERGADALELIISFGLIPSLMQRTLCK
jgi:hypothetical protein